MKKKFLKIDQNEQSADSLNLETDRSRFLIAVKVLSIFSIFFGVILLITWYLSTPVLRQVYSEWMPRQFNIVVGILLVAMGVFLAFITGLAINMWRKGERLRKNWKDEIARREKVEKELARAQEISKTGNWLLELPSQRMQWSNETQRILDCSLKNSNMNLQGFLKSVHLDDRGFVKKEIQKSLEQGTAFNLTHRIVRRDGSIRIVKQRSEIYLDQKGKPVQILGTLQDITDRKEAENLATRLGRILDKSFNEIYIFDAETYKFAKVNLAARLNLRYTMTELYKMTPVDLLPEFTWKQFEVLTDSLKRGIESVTAFETVFKRNNGVLYPVDIRLQLSRTETRPQFVAIVQDISDRKKLKNLLGTAHQDVDKQVHERTLDLTISNKELQIEINEQKQALEAFEANEHYLIKIMDNVADGLITIDEEGIIHSFNRAAEILFGYKTEDALGQNIDDLLSGPDDSQRVDYFKTLLQSKKSAALGLRRVFTARKKDGTSLSAELVVSETVIEDKRMFTGLIRDLTENEQTEQESMEILKPITNA